MNFAARAYGQTATMATTPREGEARALLKAASRIQLALSGDKVDRSDLDSALIYNRNLWIEIVTRVSDADNPLSKQVKESILALGQFVFKHTLACQVGKDSLKSSVLIDLNQNLALGLQGSAGSGKIAA